MKCRKGFVSNSSSSSFIVSKDKLTEKQIKDLIDICSMPIGPYQDSWSVYEYSDAISGFTVIHNGCCEGDGGLPDWFKENGFPLNDIVWDKDI